MTPVLVELHASLREAGLLVGVQRLHSTESATSVRVRDGETEIVDGPFAVTKEVLAGYYVLDCADLDEALKQAARLPMAPWATIEVRPVMSPEEWLNTARRPASTCPTRRSSTWRERRRARPGLGRDRARVPRRARDRPGHADPAGRRLPARRGRGAGRVRGRGHGVAARRRPGQAGAWITTAARRRAIDRLRRDRSVADRAERLAELMRLDAEHEEQSMDDESTIVDDRLRLIFTCCHPALDMPARVALTLRALGGMTTGEIARAFLVAEPTMGKRIVRAKRKIADAHIPYRVPADEELPDRLRGVLRVVYLIFNEGYAAAEGDRLVREELCNEAIRLGELLCRLMPDDAEVWGLLALMLLHDARRAARVDRAAGTSRSTTRTGRSGMRTGSASASRSWSAPCACGAGRVPAPGRDHGPADPGPDAEATDWAQIAELYGALAALNPSPVVELNRAVAVGLASGPAAGLELLEPLLGDPALERYQPLHAAHAELLSRAGDAEGAARAYERAIALTANAVERAELERRLSALR